MYHYDSAGSISYAEFRHLGKEDKLGRYSLHYHLVGSSMRGSYVLGASIWDSHNRWLTIHGTNYLVVRDCVGYKSVGHGFFLEDGTEAYNVLDRNLAVQAYLGKRLPKQVLPFDPNDGAGFWWANCLNTFTRNVSVENDRYGYRFEATPGGRVNLTMPVLQPDGRYAPRDIVVLAEGGNYLQESPDYGASGGNTGSAFVIDITDPRNPVVLNRWRHPHADGHHPIRYYHEAQFLDGDKSVILVTDEDLHNGCGDAGGIVAVRVAPSLTGEPQELSEWFIPAGTPAPVCSVHVFSSQGDVVFLGSYNAGLQVVDYSDPRAPVQAGYYIAPATTAWGAFFHEGYIYVGDMSRGLDVYQIDDPELLLKLKLKPKKLLP